MSEKSNPKSNQSEEIATYIWDGSGPYTRREGGSEMHLGKRVSYKKGDKIDLTPQAAKQHAGSIKTLGGMLLSPDMFDGVTHPRVATRQPMYPGEREAAEAAEAKRRAREEEERQRELAAIEAARQAAMPGKTVSARSAAAPIPDPTGDETAVEAASETVTAQAIAAAVPPPETDEEKEARELYEQAKREAAVKREKEAKKAERTAAKKTQQAEASAAAATAE